MITPLDIENKRFSKKTLNGYDPEEVDDFLDELTKDYANIYKKVNENDKELEELRLKVEHYTQIELLFPRRHGFQSTTQSHHIYFLSCYPRDLLLQFCFLRHHTHKRIYFLWHLGILSIALWHHNNWLYWK